ncbi:hydrolase [Brevibacillus reuszeri]|uniref:Hydrolase n=1 Tax=Brevibacillus reuszeri TaxID=54915 RepID=A0A0K9YZE4_9BACL|nr:alpha/beta hydrolase [Brevibacillus reuszeri]KNB73590.1 hypothetical protein ADS79_06510 [Brevibacillus reuszeri]MED1858609.1 alpha/beta hydrolase [Brevibacillus reuszeri]GED69585.1 hydrolase [Brevibacillus reuszeri]
MGQSGFKSVNGADIYYEIAGEGETIVLVHGAPLDSRMWEPQMEVLSKQFQVIRYDMRGLGKSKDPGQPFTLYEDLYSLLHELGIKKATFVGASFGSYVSVEFSLAYPEMVERLLLVCPGGFEVPSEDRQQWFKKIMEAMSYGQIEAALELNLNLILDGPDAEKGRVQKRREWIHDIYRDIFSQPPKEVNKPNALQPDPRERLAEVSVPACVVYGQLDHPDFIETAKWLASEIPQAKSVKFENSAHLPNIDSPEELNALIVEWCSNYRVE